MPDAFKFPDEKSKEEEITVEVASPEIEVVDDTPEQDRGRKPMAAPPKELSEDDLNKYDESVKKRIQHFTKGYHEERRAKEAAQREKEEALRLAQAIVEENKQLRGSLSQGHNALLEQAKRVVASEVEAAERKYRAAYDSGDSEALVAAQRELTVATLKADKVANFKPESLQPPEFRVQLPEPQAQPQRQPQPVIDDKLQNWRSENSWFGEDEPMTAYALGLHKRLAEEGVPVGSDSYYNKLNADIRKRFPERFEAEQNESQGDASTRRRTNVVAPATRSTAPRKVVLTSTQVSIAKRLGVPLELYAKKVAEEMRK